jgi:aspartyl-tRNA(Asn)/glutamyl-tRNA(Gln) amidotransferase subunit A
MRTEIAELSAHEIVARLKAGDLSAEAVLDATLERIEAVEGGIASLGGDSSGEHGVHAYISLAEERARYHDDPGLLAGVPIAVKDIFCVSGTPSTAGSKILANFIAPYTATPVARLEKAGAIISANSSQSLV